MATVAKETMTLAGLVATYNAASGGGDKCPAGDNVFLHVINGAGIDVEVTLTTPGTAAPGVGIEDPVIDVLTGTDAFIGPLNRDLLRNPVDGLVDIAWESTTSVTFAVITL